MARDLVAISKGLPSYLRNLPDERLDQLSAPLKRRVFRHHQGRRAGSYFSQASEEGRRMAGTNDSWRAARGPGKREELEAVYRRERDTRDYALKSGFSDMKAGKRQKAIESGRMVGGLPRTVHGTLMRPSDLRTNARDTSKFFKKRRRQTTREEMRMPNADRLIESLE